MRSTAGGDGGGTLSAEPSPSFSATAASPYAARLHDRFGAAVLALCVTILRDEEIAAEILCECCRAAPEGDTSEVGAWLVTEAHRRAVSALRASGAADDADGAIAAASQRLLAFEVLGDEQRLIVSLVYYEGLTIADVARRFALPAERVSRALTSALRLMREASMAVVTADCVVDGGLPDHVAIVAHAGASAADRRRPQARWAVPSRDLSPAVANEPD